MTPPESEVDALTPHRQIIGDAAFHTVARHLQDQTGIVLSEAKRGLAVSRLSRRLRLLGLADFDAYCDVLAGPGGEAELQEMILMLTTNVTRFFREPHHFKVLKTHVLPGLIAKATSGGRVRIWSAGSSSGEEAYSIAMGVLDAFPQAITTDFRILATDIDINVLQIAQKGRYKISAEDRAEHPLLEKYMQAAPDSADHQDVVPEVRSLVQFAKLNLQDPWPMKRKFDVIFCRNVVIYFSSNTQERLWPRFANALTPDGHLMIGHSERVMGPATNLLKSVGVTHYQLKAQGGVR